MSKKVLEVWNLLEKKIYTEENHNRIEYYNGKYKEIRYDSRINMYSLAAIATTFFLWDFAKGLLWKYLPKTAGLIFNQETLKPIYSSGIFRIIRIGICLLALIWIWYRQKRHTQRYISVSKDIYNKDGFEVDEKEITDYCMDKFEPYLSQDLKKDRCWVFSHMITGTEKALIGGYLKPGEGKMYLYSDADKYPFEKAYSEFWALLGKLTHQVYIGKKDRDELIADILTMNTPLGDYIHKFILRNHLERKKYFESPSFEKEVKEYDLNKAREEAIAFLKEEDNYYLWKEAYTIKLISKEDFDKIKARFDLGDSPVFSDNPMEDKLSSLFPGREYDPVCHEKENTIHGIYFERIATVAVLSAFLILGCKPFMEALKVFVPVVKHILFPF